MTTQKFLNNISYVWMSILLVGFFCALFVPPSNRECAHLSFLHQEQCALAVRSRLNYACAIVQSDAANASKTREDCWGATSFRELEDTSQGSLPPPELNRKVAKLSKRLELV
jgi:hypothetical protein